MVTLKAGKLSVYHQLCPCIHLSGYFNILADLAERLFSLASAAYHSMCTIESTLKGSQLQRQGLVIVVC